MFLMTASKQSQDEFHPDSVSDSLLRRFYRGADKSLARPTSRCILFDGENISFDASLIIQAYLK